MAGAAAGQGDILVSKEPSFAALPPIAVGILVSDARAVPVLLREGRSAAPDAVFFSRDSASYRVVYLKSLSGEEHETLTFSVPPDMEPHRFDSVIPATKQALSRRGFLHRYQVVEAKINEGLGSPTGEGSFLASALRVVDVPRLGPDALEATIESAISECSGSSVGRKVLEAIGAGNNSSATSANVTRRVDPYVTWDSERQQILVSCLIEVTSDQRKGGTGIVPNRDLQINGAAGVPYGDLTRATATMTYSVAASGEIILEQTSPVTVTKYAIPPPGHQVPQ